MDLPIFKPAMVILSRLCRKCYEKLFNNKNTKKCCDGLILALSYESKLFKKICETSCNGLTKEMEIFKLYFTTCIEGNVDALIE